ncbi:uncharacterized protein IWZ02DRAFT_145780 [Phyllosticta citriasiana]|uniref:Uncharacterized protein n=1 Tax=Phyllosticta citriasiana TaxID=595635 RepID=A0ABR1KE04_9PEZI
MGETGGGANQSTCGVAMSVAVLSPVWPECDLTWLLVSGSFCCPRLFALPFCFLIEASSPSFCGPNQPGNSTEHLLLRLGSLSSLLFDSPSHSPRNPSIFVAHIPPLSLTQHQTHCPIIDSKRLVKTPQASCNVRPKRAAHHTFPLSASSDRKDQRIGFRGREFRHAEWPVYARSCVWRSSDRTLSSNSVEDEDLGGFPWVSQLRGNVSLNQGCRSLLQQTETSTTCARFFFALVSAAQRSAALGRNNDKKKCALPDRQTERQMQGQGHRYEAFSSPIKPPRGSASGPPRRAQAGKHTTHTAHEARVSFQGSATEASLSSLLQTIRSSAYTACRAAAAEESRRRPSGRRRWQQQPTASRQTQARMHAPAPPGFRVWHFAAVAGASGWAGRGDCRLLLPALLRWMWWVERRCGHDCQARRRRRPLCCTLSVGDVDAGRGVIHSGWCVCSSLEGGVGKVRAVCGRQFCF